jgi:hypothetical protein
VGRACRAGHVCRRGLYVEHLCSNANASADKQDTDVLAATAVDAFAPADHRSFYF